MPRQGLPPIGGEVEQEAARSVRPPLPPIGSEVSDVEEPRAPEVHPYAKVAHAARASLAQAVFGGGDLIRRGWNAVAPESMEVERVINRPVVQAGMQVPSGGAGFLGSTIGDLLLYGPAVGGVASAVRKAWMPVRMAAEGAAAAGVAGVQSAGDPGQMAVAGTVGALLPGAGALVRRGGQAVQHAAAGAAQGGVGGAIAAAVRTTAPLQPADAIVRAIKPRSTRTNFPDSVKKALPELKAAEASMGAPIESLDALMKASKVAKTAIQQELNALRGNAAPIGVDLSPVADAMVDSIPRKMWLERPGAARRLVKAANVYRQRFSVEDAEVLRREMNAELDSFYAMYPRGQHSALLSNPRMAALDAQGKAIRKVIDTALDPPGEGAASRELHRRYGALLEVEGEAVRRANVAARQQPESLSEQIAGVRAAADMARGAWRLYRGDVFGMADMAAAAAGRSTAKFMKEQQTTDALIRRAFADFRGPRIPVPMPPPRVVQGEVVMERPELPPGRPPVVTPPPGSGPRPPDPSFVRGVPAQSQFVQRPALPAGWPARPMGPADIPDASRVGGVPAAPIAHEINPSLPVSEGGYRVQYSGQPGAVPVPLVGRPEVRHMLQRMKADLETLTPQKGRLVRDPNDPNFSIYAAGGPGSAVGDDVRVISRQRVSNREIHEAIEQLLNGQRPTNKLHTAALDAALGYLARRPGYRGPVVPDEEAFEAFSRAVDDLSER